MAAFKTGGFQHDQTTWYEAGGADPVAHRRLHHPVEHAEELSLHSLLNSHDNSLWTVTSFAVERRVNFIP
jgi:hypothetical protein